MEHMQAIVVHAFGGPDVLSFETVPVPGCGPNELLVQVRAAGVGPWDAWVRAGSSAVPQALPLTPGSDVSGIVQVVGEEVEGFLPGDPVYGTTNACFTNGYAQLAACDAAMMAHKPVSLTHVEAASVPVIATTAWQMLFQHAELHEGQRVLVHGAKGNVGRFAVQFASFAGLEVNVTPSGGQTASLADVRAAELSTLLEPRPIYDAAIDLVGGETQRQLFGWIKEGGALVSAVGKPDTELAVSHHIDARFILVHVNTGELEMIGKLLDRGAIKPWVGETLPLTEARAAHEMLAGARANKPGKIVLLP